MSFDHKQTQGQNPNPTSKEENTSPLNNTETEQNTPETQETEKQQDTVNEELEKVKQELEKAKQELNEQKDQYIRLAAEYDNYRKRTIKEKDNIFEESKAFTLACLIPCLDNLDRVMSVENANLEDYKKGVEMTISHLFETLKTLGVEEIDALGKPFDPMLQEAVAHIEDENAGENTVVEVLQKGYKIGDRVLRHAAVKVAN